MLFCSISTGSYGSHADPINIGQMSDEGHDQSLFCCSLRKYLELDNFTFRPFRLFHAAALQSMLTQTFTSSELGRAEFPLFLV